MEFATVGLVPIDPPPTELKPFMRNKLKTWFRSWDIVKDGKAVRKDLMEEFNRKALEYGEEDREDRIEDWMSKCDFVLFCSKNSDTITEDEFVEAWLERIYADKESREETMEELKGVAGMLFRQWDQTETGYLTFQEFQEGTGIYNKNIIKILFDAVDVDGTGKISMHEFVYGMLHHHMNSGPENPFSLYFGPIIDDKVETSDKTSNTETFCPIVDCNVETSDKTNNTESQPQQESRPADSVVSSRCR